MAHYCPRKGGPKAERSEAFPGIRLAAKLLRSQRDRSPAWSPRAPCRTAFGFGGCGFVELARDVFEMNIVQAQAVGVRVQDSGC